MTRQIVFATVPALAENVLREALAQFEASQNMHVELKIVPWVNNRSDFADMALRQQPVDVALVGSPVMSDLLGMNILRPFLPSEINSMGGSDAFLPSRWNAEISPGDARIFAIPYVVDVRVLYYWCDMLKKAGIDEQSDFLTIELLTSSIHILREHGVQAPWEMWDEKYEVLHCASSWIWAMGGELISADGAEVLFNQPLALAGLRNYFDLLKFVPAHRNGLPMELFRKREIALGIGDAWVFSQEIPPDLGCSSLPGGSYIGGSDLVVWNSTHYESAALQLVRFLCRPDIHDRLVLQTTPTIPSRMELLIKAAAKSPAHEAIVRTAQLGRMYPCVPMIGLVEERLSAALAMIQQELLANHEIDPAVVIKPHLEMLAKRINTSLKSIPRR